MFNELEPLIELTLPFPPSLNTYYRKWNNRLVLSDSGRLYKEEVRLGYLQSKVLRNPIEILIFAHIDLYPPDKRRRDVDNYCKGLFDSLEYAQVFKNDNQIKGKWVSMKEMIDKEGKCLVRLYDNQEVEEFVSRRSIERDKIESMRVKTK